MTVSHTDSIFVQQDRSYCPASGCQSLQLAPVRVVCITYTQLFRSSH